MFSGVGVMTIFPKKYYILKLKINHSIHNFGIVLMKFLGIHFDSKCKKNDLST